MAAGHFDVMTVAELKDKCRSLGLKISGSRLELVERLRQRQRARSVRQPAKKRSIEAGAQVGQLKRRLVGKQAVTAADWAKAPPGWIPSAAADLAESLLIVQGHFAETLRAGEGVHHCSLSTDPAAKHAATAEAAVMCKAIEQDSAQPALPDAEDHAMVSETAPQQELAEDVTEIEGGEPKSANPIEAEAVEESNSVDPEGKTPAMSEAVEHQEPAGAVDLHEDVDYIETVDPKSTQPLFVEATEPGDPLETAENREAFEPVNAETLENCEHADVKFDQEESARLQCSEQTVSAIPKEVEAVQAAEQHCVAMQPDSGHDLLETADKSKSIETEIAQSEQIQSVGYTSASEPGVRPGVKEEQLDPDFAPESSEEEVIELPSRAAAPVFTSPLGPSPGLSPSPSQPAAPPPSPVEGSVPAPPSSWWLQSPSDLSFLKVTYSRLMEKAATSKAREDQALPSPPRWEPRRRPCTPKQDQFKMAPPPSPSPSSSRCRYVAASPNAACSPARSQARSPALLTAPASPSPARSPASLAIAASPTPARSPASFASPASGARQSVADSKQRMLKELTAQMQQVLGKLSAPGISEQSRTKYQQLANAIKKQIEKLNGIGTLGCSPSPAKALLISDSSSAISVRRGGC